MRRKMNDYKSKINFPAENIYGKGKVCARELTESMNINNTIQSLREERFYFASSLLFDVKRVLLEF